MTFEHDHPYEHAETREAEQSEPELHHGEGARRPSSTTERTEPLSGPLRDEGLTPDEMVNHPDIQGVYPFQEQDASIRGQGAEAYDEAAGTEEEITYGGMGGSSIPTGEWQGEAHDPEE